MASKQIFAPPPRPAALAPESNWVRVSRFASIGIGATSTAVLLALVALAVYAFNTTRAKDITSGLQSHAQNQIDITFETIYATIRGEYEIVARAITCFMGELGAALREFNPFAELPTFPVGDPHNCTPCAHSRAGPVDEVDPNAPTSATVAEPTKLYLEY